MSTSEAPWTVGRLLNWTVEYLGKHSAENPRLDAEVLLAHARGCKRIELYTAFGEVASDEVRTAFRELVKRRADGAPVAYLVGHREFYSLDFEVNDDVLIPRPETESLVVALLDHANPKVNKEEGEAAGSPVASPQQPVPITIADVGTGSGILAICAAKYLPQARVSAIDISPAALVIARRNAERHGVADRITFVEANLFATEPEGSRFDYIVSNPPYISTAEMQQLAPDVRDYEPHTALHAGETGTEVISPLVAQAATRLKPGGTLLIEISPMIATVVEQLIRGQSVLELEPTIKDLAGHARVVQATKKKSEH